MGRRLKQIKINNLGSSAKKVIDSLIVPIKVQKEVKLEQMRCKVEILEGNINLRLVDSLVINTDSIDKLATDIQDKYGENVQYKITNLYNEQIVAKRLSYTGGYDKDKTDREHFASRMNTINKILKLKEEGHDIEDVVCKISHLAGKEYIRSVFNSTEEIQKQNLRNVYENQSLGL
jgi:hypothetical protein